MPDLFFIAADGASHAVQARAGQSAMQAAVDAGLPGILGDCGGSCSCATCHVYVADPWIDRLPAADDAEAAMLDGVLHPQAGSRLSCQIALSDALTGLVLHLPVSQI